MKFISILLYFISIIWIVLLGYLENDIKNGIMESLFVLWYSHSLYIAYNLMNNKFNKQAILLGVSVNSLFYIIFSMISYFTNNNDMMFVIYVYTVVIIPIIITVLLLISMLVNLIKIKKG